MTDVPQSFLDAFAEPFPEQPHVEEIDPALARVIGERVGRLLGALLNTRDGLDDHEIASEEVIDVLEGLTDGQRMRVRFYLTQVRTAIELWLPAQWDRR